MYEMINNGGLLHLDCNFFKLEASNFVKWYIAQLNQVV